MNRPHAAATYSPPRFRRVRACASPVGASSLSTSCTRGGRWMVGSRYGHQAETEQSVALATTYIVHGSQEAVVEGVGVDGFKPACGWQNIGLTCVPSISCTTQQRCCTHKAAASGARATNCRKCMRAASSPSPNICTGEHVVGAVHVRQFDAAGTGATSINAQQRRTGRQVALTAANCAAVSPLHPTAPASAAAAMFRGT